MAKAFSWSADFPCAVYESHVLLEFLHPGVLLPTLSSNNDHDVIGR
jgi:hypothetical protein